MHITTAILAILATVALGIEEGIIRAPILRNPNNGNPLEIAKRRLQSIQKRQLDKRDPFQAPLYNDQGSQYLIQVGIGSPAQTFTVTLDTGRQVACPLLFLFVF